jgi:ribosome-associated toxin RatA of RatAB toxin-antitoxin module
VATAIIGETSRQSMRELKRTALVNRTPAEIYRLVNDIASYPAFVPGCTAAQVLSQDESEIVARLAVRRGPLHTQFTTRNRLTPSTSVHMQLVDGPFRVLEGEWQFRPVGVAGCEIELRLRYQFSSPLKTALLEPLLKDIADQLVHAFIRRSQQADV